MDAVIENLIKLGGGYILAAVGYIIIYELSKQRVAREQEIANERVNAEKRMTDEQRRLAEQYRQDCGNLMAVVQQNTAAFTRLETAFEQWSKAGR